MHSQHDPTEPPDPTAAMPPSVDWDQEATVVGTPDGALPPELQAQLPDAPDDLRLDEEDLAEAPVPDASGDEGAAAVAPKKKKKRGMGCALAAVGGLVVLGVVAVALVGVAVVGVAGAGGAVYYLTTGEVEVSTPDELASVAAPIVDDGVALAGADAGGVEDPEVTPKATLPAEEDDTDSEGSHASGTPDEAPLGAGVEPSQSSTRPSASSSNRSAAASSSSSNRGSSQASGGGDDVDLLAEDDEDDFGLVDEPIIKVEKGSVKVDSKAAAKVVGASLQRGTSQVSVNGSGVKVTLIKGGKRLSVPGKIAAGRYDIEATFDGEPPVVVGMVKVKSGTPVSLNCNARMGICRVQ